MDLDLNIGCASTLKLKIYVSYCTIYLRTVETKTIFIRNTNANHRMRIRARHINADHDLEKLLCYIIYLVFKTVR